MGKTSITINQGGLIRCCIDTLSNHEDISSVGKHINCKYCDASMILEKGVWKWNPPDDELDTE